MKRLASKYRLLIIPLLILIAIPIWAMIYQEPCSPTHIEANSSDASFISYSLTHTCISPAIDKLVIRPYKVHFIIDKLFIKPYSSAFEAFSHKEIFNPSKYSVKELFEKADTLTFPHRPHIYKPIFSPRVPVFSKNHTVVANIYAMLYDNNLWTGFSTSCNSLDIFIENGEIWIDHSPTGVKTNARIYYDIAKELYNRRVWDGMPMKLGAYTISLSLRGYIIADDFVIGNCYDLVDVPTSFESSMNRESNILCIPGQGSYVIIDNELVKFSHGELLPLPGGKLDFGNVDLGKYIEHSIYLEYNRKYDKMLLCLTGDEEYYSEELDMNYIGPSVDTSFLYIFPNYNKSKVEFVSNFDPNAIGYSTEDQYIYLDEKGIWWELTESGFVKTKDPTDF